MGALQRLQTDFNDTTGSTVTVLIEDAGIIPAKGDAVLLVDVDGNSCAGVVKKISNDLIYVAPDWKSWVDAAPFEPSSPPPDLVDVLIAGARARSGHFDDAQVPKYDPA